MDISLHGITFHVEAGVPQRAVDALSAYADDLIAASPQIAARIEKGLTYDIKVNSVFIEKSGGLTTYHEGRIDINSYNTGGLTIGDFASAFGHELVHVHQFEMAISRLEAPAYQFQVDNYGKFGAQNISLEYLKSMAIAVK